MSIISKPYTFSQGATIVASEHNANFDTLYNDYNGNITNSNLSATFNLTDSQIGQISTYGKVNATSITGLGSTNASAGIIPTANLPVGTSANNIVQLDGSAKLPAVDGSQLTNINTSTNSTQVTSATDISGGSEADMTGMSITLTTKGTKLLCNFFAPFYNAAGGSSTMSLILNYDGSNVATPWKNVGNLLGSGTGSNACVSFSYLLTGLTPGSHTIKIRWIGSAIAQYGSTDGPRVFNVIDLE